MSGTKSIRIGQSLNLAACCAFAWACPALAQWPQWGGPNRDFIVDTEGLAVEWPADGPLKLWQRELGDGYSSVAVDDGVLYTMCRKKQADNHEYTVAIDAKSGKTLWEHKQASPVPDQGRQFPGPNTSPLVIEGRLYTVGRNAVLHCHQANDGKVLWNHDLVAEFGAAVPGWGYSSSPIAYKDTVIVATGRHGQPESVQVEGAGTGDPPSADGHFLLAFDQVTGKLAWKSQDFPAQFSSPILIRFAGQDQLVALPGGAIIGVDPSNGKLLWRHDVPGDEYHYVTPVWDGKELLFAGTGKQSCVLKLSSKDGKTVPEEVWSNRKVGLGLSTPVRQGDLVVACKGGQSTLLLGVDLQTGKRKWAKRGFASTTLLSADGKVILLDENGQLAMGTATAEGLTIHSLWQIPDWSNHAYTAPTLVGRTLYVRDRKNLAAFDLAAAAYARAE